jgi:predicted RNase H-like HicB family nuclease
MDNVDHPHEHHLTCHVHKGKVTGIYIGKLKEIPGIIAYANTKEELHKKINEAMTAYFQAFPKQHDIIFKDKTEESVEQIPVTI